MALFVIAQVACANSSPRSLPVKTPTIVLILETNLRVLNAKDRPEHAILNGLPSLLVDLVPFSGRRGDLNPDPDNQTIP
jgi:hypothetical protein